MIEIQPCAYPKPHAFEIETPGLIEMVGRLGFSDRFLAAARRVTNCHTVTAFSFADGRSPQLILANNIGDTPISQKVAEKYISDYWRYDPANRVCGELEDDNSCKALMIDANDIDYEPYRNHCYTSVNLHNRMTIIKATDGGFIRVSFYMDRKGGCFDRGMEVILSAGNVLAALLQRHNTWNDDSTSPSAASPSVGHNCYKERLRNAGFGLSERELEVCALIARGFTSEGIALELGIAINTVLTFRKRAYARLRISSQNELMHLILN